MKQAKNKIRHLNKKGNEFLNLRFKAFVVGSLWYFNRKLKQIDQESGMENDAELNKLQTAFNKVLYKKKWSWFYKIIMRWGFNIFKIFIKHDNAYYTLVFETIKQYKPKQRRKNGKK